MSLSRQAHELIRRTSKAHAPTLGKDTATGAARGFRAAAPCVLRVGRHAHGRRFVPFGAAFRTLDEAATVARGF